MCYPMCDNMTAAISLVKTPEQTVRYHLYHFHIFSKDLCCGNKICCRNYVIDKGLNVDFFFRIKIFLNKKALGLKKLDIGFF